MPHIKLEHINKRWGKTYGVEDLNMVIEDNAFVTLLGPSGCGKTTVLRMIAGLETPSTGRITIGDRVVFDSSKGINVPTSDRRVGFLFQNYALWPNMNVYNNISYGLTEVKAELSIIDFEAKNYVKLATIIANPAEVREIINSCMDSSGVFDYNKAVIRLTDRYEISHFMAKQVLSYDYSSNLDFTPEVRELMGKADLLIAKNRLNENFEYTDENGNVIKVIRKYTKEEVDLAVRRVARILRISTLMDKMPTELSAGEQQRVFMARTLAPQPNILFMDEPLSNLDAKLKTETEYELQRIHIETGATFIYVTHDQAEAMNLSTKICVLNNGFLQQYDEPLTVYAQPKNTFIADFVGSPSINFVEAKGAQNANGEIELSIFDGTHSVVYKPKVALNLAEWLKARPGVKTYNPNALNTLPTPYNANGDNAVLHAGREGTPVPEKRNRHEVYQYHINRIVDDESPVSPVITDEDFLLAIRPEYVVISEMGRFEGEVYSSMPSGMDLTLKIRMGNYLITGLAYGNQTQEIGKTVKFDFAGDFIILFDRKTGRYISLGSVSDIKPDSYVSVGTPNIIYVDRIVEKEVEKIVYLPNPEAAKEAGAEEKPEVKEKEEEVVEVVVEEEEETKKEDDKPKHKPPLPTTPRRPKRQRRLPRRTSTVEVEPGYWLDRHEFNTKMGM